MNKKTFYLILSLLGLLLVAAGLLIDILRGRPISLGWIQLGLVIIGGLLFTLSIVGSMVGWQNVTSNLVQLNEVYIRAIRPLKGKESLFAIILVVLCILMFIWPVPQKHDTPDIAYYLSLAKNLFWGNGYVNPDLSPAIYRGPIFPMLISFSYHLFGYDTISAIVMVRLFWAFTVLGVFLLVRDLFNRRAGLIAAILVATAAVISNVFEYVLTDGILTCFIVFSMWLIWRSFSRNGTIWLFLISGVMFGITYLVKQSALFLAPIPFLIWLLSNEYRKKSILFRVVIFYAIFGLFLGGWMMFVYLSGGSNGQVLGDLRQISRILATIPESFGNLIADSAPVAKQIDRSSSILDIIVRFSTKEIGNSFSYAIIFLPGILFSLIQAVVRKSRADLFILLCALFFCFMLPNSVVVNYGDRQFVFLYMLFIMMTAGMLGRIFIIKRELLVDTLVVMTLVISVVGQFIQHPLPLTSLSSQEVSYSLFDRYQPIAEWINEHTTNDSKILVPDRDDNRLHVLTTGNRRIFSLEYCRGEDSFHPAVACKPPYIYLWINRGIADPVTPRDNLLGITEENLLNKILKEGISYLIIPPSIDFTNEYFGSQSAYKQMTAIDGFTIYQIDRQKLIDSPRTLRTCLGGGTADYLKKLVNEHPDILRKRLAAMYTPWMGLTESDIAEFSNWSGCSVPVK